MSAHRFGSQCTCVWCGVTMEKVKDRKAPPFCEEAPDNDRPTPGTGGY